MLKKGAYKSEIKTDQMTLSIIYFLYLNKLHYLYKIREIYYLILPNFYSMFLL
jgi:hypothetical protein